MQSASPPCSKLRLKLLDSHAILEALLLIDSHAHLDSPRYADDREAMLDRACEAGVGAVLSIGIGEGPAEMHQALDLCREFNGQA